MPDFDNVIDDILSRCDIVDIIGERIHLTKRGANYVGLCPFHQEKTGSFSVSRSKNMFYCFGCHKGGNVITFIKEYENMTGGEAVRYLAGRAGIELPERSFEKNDKKEQLKNTLYDINKDAAIFYVNLLNSNDGKAGREYFAQRGLTEKTIVHYGLGLADAKGDSLYRYLKDKGYEDDMLDKSGLIVIDEKHGPHDRFWNRVMFPILNERGKVLGFGGRVMGKGEPKYLNSPETFIFNKSNTFYGIKDARKSRKDTILICEGYMDVIALWSAGFDNAVAALGTAFTPLHARNINRFGKKVVLTLDSDFAGMDGAVRAIRILRNAGVSCRVLTMKPYKDPDEFMKNLGPEEYQKRIDDAESAFVFELLQKERKADLSTPEDRTRFYNDIAEHICRISKTDMERNNYIACADSMYHMGVAELRKHCNEILPEIMRRVEQEEARENRTPGVTENEPVTEAVQAPIRRQKDDGLVKSEKLLLTWAATDKRIIKALKRYIEPDCFTGVYEKICNILYENEEKGISPAAVIDKFPEEEQSAVADVFSYDLVEDMGENEQEKTFSDTVRNILQKRLRERLDEATRNNDVALFMKLGDEEKELKKKIIKITG